MTNKQTHSFHKKFDNLQSRIAFLKSVKNLKEEFNRDSSRKQGYLAHLVKSQAVT